MKRKQLTAEEIESHRPEYDAAIDQVTKLQIEREENIKELRAAIDLHYKYSRDDHSYDAIYSRVSSDCDIDWLAHNIYAINKALDCAIKREFKIAKKYGFEE